MKNWNRPEMIIFNVKMDENIASSGAGSENNYEVQYIYYDLGGITRGGANYKCKDSYIQDTSIQYTDGGGQKTVSSSNVGQISGCLAG